MTFSFSEFLQFTDSEQLKIVNYLKEHYIINNKNKQSIANELDVSMVCLSKILKKFNIKKSKKLVAEQRKQTCLEKYGVSTPFQSEEVKNKIKQTSLKRYGVEHPSQSKEVQEKMKQTCFEKYGCKFVTQVKTIQEKMKQTSIEHFGIDNYNNRKQAANTIKNKSIEEKELFKEKTKQAWAKKTNDELQNIIKKSKQTKLEKYGNENYYNKEKFRQTSFEKYGVDHPSKSKEVQEKIKQTCLEKYGVEYPSQSKEFQEKYKKTSLDKYGVEHPFKSNVIKNKIIKTNLKKYNRESYNQTHISINNVNICKCKESFLKFISNIPFEKRTLWYLHELLEYSDIQIYRKCLEFNCLDLINLSNSMYELDFKKWLDSLNVDCYINYRKILYPKEIDIFIPDKMIGIEINGIYWHCVERDKSYKNYHQEKSLLAREKGIFIYHIFEHELMTKTNKNSILTELEYMITSNDFIPKQLRGLNKNEFPNELLLDFTKENPKDYEKYGYKIVSLSKPTSQKIYNHTLYNCGYYLIKRSPDY